MHFVRLVAKGDQAHKVHETSTLIARNFAKYSPILISSSRLFSDVIVSQSRVTKYAKSCGIISNRLTANLLRNLPVKKMKIG